MKQVILDDEQDQSVLSSQSVHSTAPSMQQKKIQSNPKKAKEKKLKEIKRK